MIKVKILIKSDLKYRVIDIIKLQVIIIWFFKKLKLIEIANNKYKLEVNEVWLIINKIKHK